MSPDLDLPWYSVTSQFPPCRRPAEVRREEVHVVSQDFARTTHVVSITPKIRGGRRQCISLLLSKLSASIVDKTQVIVLDGADGRNVPLLDSSSLDLQSDATSRSDDNLLIFRNPSISLPIKAIEHILRHGMLRNEYPQRSDKGKEAEGVALRYGGVEDLVKERSKEESRVTHIEYDVSRVIFDNSLGD